MHFSVSVLPVNLLPLVCHTGQAGGVGGFLLLIFRVWDSLAYKEDTTWVPFLRR